MSAFGLEQRSLGYSVMLHIGILLIALFGIPAILSKPPEPEPMVMTVDILPISSMTNVKPSDQPLEKKQEAKVQPAAKPLPKPVAAPPTPKAAPQEPTFNPMEDKKAEEKPKPEEKQEPKKEDKQFQDVLKNLQKEADKKPDTKKAKDNTTTPENTTRSNAPYDPSMPLSLSEKDAIKNQFIKCWRMPAGAKDPHSLAVRIHVMLKEDGSLISSEIAQDQMARYNSEPFFRAAADSAMRAVAQCTQPPMGPLKDLPPDKYGSWRDMELNFDPSELLY